MHEKIKATIFYYPKIKNQDKKKNICIQIKCIQEIEIIVPRKIANLSMHFARSIF